MKVCRSGWFSQFHMIFIHEKGHTHWVSGMKTASLLKSVLYVAHILFPMQARSRCWTENEQCSHASHTLLTRYSSTLGDSAWTRKAGLESSNNIRVVRRTFLKIFYSYLFLNYTFIVWEFHTSTYLMYFIRCWLPTLPLQLTPIPRLLFPSDFICFAFQYTESTQWLPVCVQRPSVRE